MGTLVDEWESQGRRVAAAGHDVFLMDVPAADAGSGKEPLLVVHGFPTSSFDFRSVIPSLAADRRVVLVDMLGFGLSDKPDLHYTMSLQADVIQSVVEGLGLTAIALLTHDLGDSVGGELLGRQMAGSFEVEVTRRVLTNGSIYIEMAHLSTGQELLLSLPDEKLGAGLDEDGSSLRAGLAATFAASSVVDAEELGAMVELVKRREGQQLLPRTIRYIEERRADQARYTGPIEAHPSPLHVIWGTEDPIAVVDMAIRVQAAVPGSTLELLDGVGHYPMVESPDRFAAAVAAALA
ncbi:MAG TPA: alpha/beta hydrolase [Acidimicrobiales bacterium]|nr:alpha/beta hydrolase [Acidimicrobiales bacterium]